MIEVYNDTRALYPEQQPGHAAARVMIDHVDLSYDFYVENNVSSLKTSLDIGNVTDIQQLQGEPPVSLEGLSLSLLFSTSTVAAKPHTIRVNGQSPTRQLPRAQLFRQAWDKWP